MRKPCNMLAGSALAVGIGLAAGSALAQDIMPPSEAAKSYSPYPGQDFPNRVFFGDTHLHTAYSTDAGMAGARLAPDDAYRFARGESVTSNMGLPAKIRRPLDFLVVADHSENLGLAVAIAEDDPNLLANEWGKMVHDETKKGTIEGMSNAYEAWMAKIGVRDDPLAADTEMPKSMWARVTESAERFNEPGLFTAFVGFEWTSMPKGKNLHRVVVFRDAKDKADKIVPISAYDTEDPEELWQWLADYEASTGGKVLAIPHNGNLSNGLMFDDVTLTTKKPIDRGYAERRMRWEPLYEVTQPKGDSEAHPLLSPEDEFADFETWDKASFGPEPHTQDMLPREYMREALKRGLAYQKKLGVNPFKYGMDGGTDMHTGLSTTDEDNFFGKVAVLEPSPDPIRFNEVIAGRPRPENERMFARNTSAAGLTAVWSRENTREALWDAMARKETFATTGTRIRVRVFGGFDFSEADLGRSDFAKNGYDKGVPMGGDLAAAPSGKAPTLLIRAVRDVDGANLDRVQVIKGWLDADGKTHEKVYDVAWSGDRQPGSDGKLPAVGNTVDVAEATYTNTIGSAGLETFWQDPDFSADQSAFYYVRVLEIPTPRWTTYDAKVFGVELPTDVPASFQERAYTSPIWYSPAG